MNPTSELYASLQDAYDYFNKALFDGELPTIIFTVQRQKGVMGYFAPNRWGNLQGGKCHEIAINPSYVANSCLIEVLQTLVHEMVHCWQHCFGKPSRANYHNQQWARKMINVGLMPSTTGMPGGSITGQKMSDYIIKDGLFARTYQILKTDSDFQLKWIDRIAATRMGYPHIFSSPVVSMDEPEQQGQVVVPSSQGDIDSLTDALITSFEQTYAELAPDQLFIAGPSRSKNAKMKYFCDGCETNVWGKPGLQLMCGSCDQAFIEAPPPE